MVLFWRVSMNGLVSHLPNEKAECGAHHPLARVKRAVHSTGNGAFPSTVRVENRSFGLSLDDTAVLQKPHFRRVSTGSSVCCEGSGMHALRVAGQSQEFRPEPFRSSPDAQR